MLLAREFIKARQILAWVSQRAPGFVSIRDLISELPLTNLPVELREAMLRFQEPGADFAGAAAQPADTTA